MKRGLTLIEILVVLAIISVLVAIAVPVFATAKRDAQEANCVSNLKSSWLAVELYRQDYDPKPVGFPYEMGLPDHILESTKIYKCASNKQPLNWPYKQVWQGFDHDTQGLWRRTIEKNEGKTAMILDINHRNENIPSFSPYFKRFGIVIRLDGSVQKIQRSGDIDAPSTWSR